MSRHLVLETVKTFPGLTAKQISERTPYHVTQVNNWLRALLRDKEIHRYRVPLDNYWHHAEISDGT